MNAAPLPALCLALGALLSCQVTEKPSIDAGPIPAGAFALVGQQALSTSLLGTEPHPPALASGITRDALLAQELLRRAPHMAQVVTRAELGRALLEELSTTALSSGGPITQAEFEEQTAALWLELDRPPAVRTARISLLVGSMEDDSAQARAMQAIADKVQAARSLQEFVALAESVDIGDLSLDLATEPPVAADGRVVPQSPADEGEERLDADYARAAHTLREIGQVSGLVGTRAGYHVIAAMDFVPGQTAPPEVRRARITKAIADARARRAFEALTQKLRSASSITKNPNQSELTRLTLRQQ